MHTISFEMNTIQCVYTSSIHYVKRIDKDDVSWYLLYSVKWIQNIVLQNLIGLDTESLMLRIKLTVHQIDNNKHKLVMINLFFKFKLKIKLSVF